MAENKLGWLELEPGTKKTVLRKRDTDNVLLSLTNSQKQRACLRNTNNMGSLGPNELQLPINIQRIYSTKWLPTMKSASIGAGIWHSC